MSVDTQVHLNSAEVGYLQAVLASALGPVEVAIDDIDQALKVKVDGRWTPPKPDADRTHLDDLRGEALDMARTGGAHTLDCRCHGCTTDEADR